MSSQAVVQPPLVRQPVRVSYTSAFVGLMLRDLRVLRRELGPFVVRIVMQPLLFLFVFTFLLPRIGQAQDVGGANFATVLLPGLMAVAIMFSGIASVALPLSQEFGVTREIDDRVMCPLPVSAVAAEKVVFSAIQSILAALLVFPMAIWVPATPVYAHVASWPMLIASLILSSLVAGALGLAIGSNVKPQQIGLVFSIVVVPITFLGCVYYPWEALHPVRWLQIGVLLNPIVYMSEGLRAALTPGVPHMPSLLILVALLISLSVLGWIGLRGFLGKVIS
ncbi:MAG TPA: ABC transporter permease [Acidobacteriaceae bacterium]|nr:ABC transporter permease [Acidobacteriaceae bacterium]